jgi:hypothetical protein
LNVVCDWAVKAGACVEREPDLRDASHSVRPDALVLCDGGVSLVDVSVTNPTAVSYSTKSAEHDLSAARAREKSKTVKYFDQAVSEHAHFVPFVLESFGAVGEQALNFIRALGSEAVAHGRFSSETSFANGMLRALSIALQKGNAQVASGGIRNTLRIHQARQPVPGKNPRGRPRKDISAFEFVTACMSSA